MILKSALAHFTKPHSLAPSLYNIVGRPLTIGRGLGKRKMKSPPQPSQSKLAWPTVTYFTIIAVFTSMLAFNTLHGLHSHPKTKWQIRGQLIRGLLSFNPQLFYTLNLDLIIDLQSRGTSLESHRLLDGCVGDHFLRKGVEEVPVLCKGDSTGD